MQFTKKFLLKISSFNKIYLIFAAFFFSLMTVCVKKVDYRIPIYELVFFRSIISLIITSWIIKKRKINPWGFNKPLLIVRGLLGTFALICIFYSIRTMPLSISTVIQYTYPIFISVFAVFFIKEKINSYILTALIFGWIGVVIILNPNQIYSDNSEINIFSIFIAFIGAIMTALAYISVKKLSKTESIFVIIKYFPLISTIILFPLILINWVTPYFYDFIWIFGIGIFTQLGQTFLTLGLKHLPASKASAINYMQVIFGSIWGIYIFNETISLNFIVGSSFVLLGTILSTSKFSKKIYHK